MKNKTIIILLFILFPLVVSLACTCGLLPIGRDKGEEAEEAVIVVTEAVVEEEPVEEVPTVEELEPIETEEQVEPTEAEEEILSPDEYLIREKDTWEITGENIYAGFVLTNQTRTMILTGVEYNIKLLDSAGEEITSDYNSFPYLFPQQPLGIFFNTSLSEDDPPVETIEITHSFEDSIDAADFPNPLSVENIKLWEDNSWWIATGIVKNADTKLFTDIRTSILCYNQAGEIIGGGYTYVDFVPGQDQMGFRTYIDNYDTVASIEAFPMLSYITDEFEASEELGGRLSIIDDNFYASSTDMLYGGVVIQSNMVDQIAQDAIMAVTFYDEEGYVTSYGYQNIDFLFPGDTLGISLYLAPQPPGSESVTYIVNLFPGEIAEDYELAENIFEVSATELTGDYEDEVTVTFTNTYSMQVTDADIYVLLYDSNGTIIGGGNTYYDEPIPPGGSAEYEVYVSYSDDYSVAEIEAWVVPSYWTTFE
jgi:hypothetical protein